MIRVRSRFWLALVLLVSLHVPAFASIGIGLHLAGDDHARQDIALALALAAAHGHHHEFDAAHHDHSAVRIAVPTAPAPEVVAVAAAPTVRAPGELVGRATHCESPPHTGPPELFYRYCALRL